MKTFGSGDRHHVRMSLICLDIIFGMSGSLGSTRTYVTNSFAEYQGSESVDLKPLVTESLECLKKSRRIQSKGVKILSALARTSMASLIIQFVTADRLTRGWRRSDKATHDRDCEHATPTGRLTLTHTA